MNSVRRRVAASVIVAALELVSLAAVADDRPGSLGFSLSIDGDGSFLNPTLRTVTVVVASPAAAAGIVPNDRIVQVEGRPITGAKASDLQPYLKRHVGEAVHLRLQRTTGEEYGVTLVAAPKG